MSYDRTTLRPSQYASWVHVLASNDDRGDRPLTAGPIALKYNYSVERTHLLFEVANSGTSDAYPAMVDWLFCLAIYGPHGREHAKYAAGEKTVMLRGHSRYPIDIRIDGDVLRGQSTGLSCFPLLFVRVADLGTPAPTRARLNELSQFWFDAITLKSFEDFLADLVGMPGFGWLEGAPFDSKV